MSQTYSLQAISQKSIDRILKQPELFALYHAGGDLEYYRDLKTDEGYLSLWDKIKFRFGMQISPPQRLRFSRKKKSHFILSPVGICLIGCSVLVGIRTHCLCMAAKI